MVTPAVTPRWVRRPARERRPWLVHVNTTETGGGVAELLHGLVPAQAACGIPVGWLVATGTPPFFALTKSLHHLLHGRGDPAALACPEPAELYRSVLLPQARWLARQLHPGDVVVLHDVQTVGMAPELAAAGIRVVWHCHVGTLGNRTVPGEVWRFLDEQFAHVSAVLSACAEFAPPRVPPGLRHVVAPAIDADAPKNRHLTRAEVAMLLADAGLTRPTRRDPPDCVVEQVRPLPEDAPTVVQVSRWDPLKDMAGLLRCFRGLPGRAHLVLAGPDPREVPDDPEGVAVLGQVRAAYAALPAAQRARVHLVTLSMRVPERNALLVNALQRRADIVVQKSIEEGFGLTVTEAMAKRRAVVAGDVGGIRAQIEHGRTGLLVDPHDDAGVVAALSRLLRDPALRRSLGDRAAGTVAERYLMPRLVADYQQYAYRTEPTSEVVS